jgi:tetratricopeptide (TPR) repeat protein
LLPEPEPELFLERAQLLVAEGRWIQALRGLDEGVRRLGPLVTLQTSALDIELSRTNYDGALSRVQTIIDAMPRTEGWLVRRGEIEMQAGRTSAAQKSFNAALAAIDALPPRLRAGQAMVELCARVESLVKQTNAP